MHVVSSEVGRCGQERVPHRVRALSGGKPVHAHDQRGAGARMQGMRPPIHSVQMVAGRRQAMEENRGLHDLR